MDTLNTVSHIYTTICTLCGGSRESWPYTCMYPAHLISSFCHYQYYGGEMPGKTNWLTYFNIRWMYIYRHISHISKLTFRSTLEANSCVPTKFTIIPLITLPPCSKHYSAEGGATWDCHTWPCLRWCYCRLDCFVWMWFTPTHHPPWTYQVSLGLMAVMTRWLTTRTPLTLWAHGKRNSLVGCNWLLDYQLHSITRLPLPWLIFNQQRKLPSLWLVVTLVS